MDNGNGDSGDENVSDSNDRSIYLHLMNIILINMTTYLIRCITRAPSRNPKLYVPLAEFLFTVEVVCSSLELESLSRSFPLFVIYTFLAILLYWWFYLNLKIKGLIIAHPAYYLEKIVISDDDSYAFIFTVVFLQIIAARLAWIFLTQFLWVIQNISEVEFICAKKRALSVCPASVLIGLLNFLERFNIYMSNSVAFLKSQNWLTVYTFMVIVTNNTFNEYFYNPFAASSVQYGCIGTITYETLLIYWIAPLIAFWPILFYICLEL